MRTDNFDFELPRSLIAQHPLEQRDSARMLEVAETARDRRIRNLPEILSSGDILVVNDTRVIPARLTGRRGEAKIDLTLHHRLPDGAWRAFAKPARRLKTGDRISFGTGFHADVIGKRDGGEVTVRPNLLGTAFSTALRERGTVPLPPYIKRPDGPGQEDRDHYQTIYARHDGAVAAPTAGLHFTSELLEALNRRGVLRATVTLHVGAGTFLPVTAENAEDHKMHAEWGRITPETASAINTARAAGGRVIAVGTTSLRLLEAAAAPDGTVKPFDGETTIYILPGYRFRAADLMMTNFHLPRSTLFMLVCAFSGCQRMKAAYAHAIREEYRFYSYGDGCLLHRKDRL